MTEEESFKHARHLDYERQQKTNRIQNMLERARIEQKETLKLREIENARPAAVPVAKEKRYIPKLPHTTDYDYLYTTLNRFADIQAARIPDKQMISRLRDLLTGQILKSFQELSNKERAFLPRLYKNSRRHRIRWLNLTDLNCFQ